LQENARAVFLDEAQAEYRLRRVSPWALPGWMRFAMPAAAAAGLAVVALAGYQNVVMLPSLRARVANLDRPQVLPAALALVPASRGTAASVDVSSGAPFVWLSLAIGAVPPAERFECEVLSDSGKTLLTIPIARLDSGGELRLLIPSS